MCGLLFCLSGPERILQAAGDSDETQPLEDGVMSAPSAFDMTMPVDPSAASPAAEENEEEDGESQDEDDEEEPKEKKEKAQNGMR